MKTLKRSLQPRTIKMVNVKTLSKLDTKNIPHNPGCYLFKNRANDVIYIGKAKNLKKRVSSYFTKNDHDPKTQNLVENIVHIDYFITDSEVEAIILENNLIKRYQPKYNIDLKDSKNYAYIHETEEKFPRLLLARNKKGKGHFYGPFVSAQERDHILYVINKTFGLRRCKRMPRKPCLRFHINICKGPCIKAISIDDYMANIRTARRILRGKTEIIIKEMSSEMKRASEFQNFERSLELRDQMAALENLSEKQKVDRQQKHDENIINYVIHENRVYLLLFDIYRGTLVNKSEFTFDLVPNFFEEFVIQYYSENDIPKELILPSSLEKPVIDFLETLRRSKIRVSVPKIGEKKKLLELVKKNIESTIFGDLTKMEALRESIDLETNPMVVECFDISHLSGTSTVGSMVQYRSARPDKSNYRRFKIKTVEGIGDTAAIAEIVRRRYFRLKNEKSELPDLVIIDGGAGQLNAALRSIHDLDLTIPVIALAKKFEDIYLPGQILPLKLDKKSSALKFIQEIRDEAHRFAIKYNRLLRSKELVR